MRRNNNVFLVGTIMQYAERTMEVEGKCMPLIDLLLQTDSPKVSGQHKVLVRGRQAEELKHFLQVAHPDLPDLMVLGWLRSVPDESLVMAERVTVLTSKEVRRAAVAAIRQEREESSLLPEA
ncbi:MAG: hypothetical protein KF893_22835 [Caldilineaceae bacterium]|nr:hypothetical protein [Caldilineaceae bacterium]